MGALNFEPEVDASLIFEKSVAGLSVGSSVRFRGFEVGLVRDIHAEFSEDYEERHTRSPRQENDTHPVEDPIVIHVRIGLRPGKIKTPPSHDPLEETAEQALRSLIADGLYAKLDQESLVTGRSFVALDFDRESRPDFRGAGGIEIPTRSEGLLQSIEEMDVKGALKSLLDTVDAIKVVLGNEDIPKILRNVNATIQGLNESTRPKVDRLAASLESQISAIGANMKTVLEKTDALVDRDSRTVYRFERLMEEWTATSRAVRALAQYLERHPEALIRGKGD